MGSLHSLKVRRIQRVRQPATCITEPYRDYTGRDDSLASVTRIIPACRHARSVTTDVHDDWHLIVEAIDRQGRPLHILVCRRGWLPIQAATITTDSGARANGYTLDVPLTLSALQLSIGDRQRIVAAILAMYLGPTDFDRLRDWKRNHPSLRQL